MEKLRPQRLCHGFEKAERSSNLVCSQGLVGRGAHRAFLARL